MSLAIVEAQKQRPAAGCVGVLFLNLLDWNRSLAKKKKKKKKQHFSMRTVLPPLLKRTSKNPLSPPHPSRSTEKTRESADMQTCCNSKTMGSASLVARLMGLDSMPISVNEKPKKSQNYDGSNKNDNYSRPQKVQKTSNGSGSFTEIANPTRLKGHEQKICALSPRSPRERLVRAAARILEPGLRPKFSQRSLRSLTNVLVVEEEEEEEEVNVGSLIETEFSIPSSKSETEEKEQMIINKIDGEFNNHGHFERNTKKMEYSRKIVKVNSSLKTHNFVEKRPSIQKGVRKQSIVTKTSTFAMNKKITNKPVRPKIFETPNNNSRVKPSTSCEKVKTEKLKLRKYSSGNSISQKDMVKINKSESNSIEIKKNSNRASFEKINGEDLSRRLPRSILEKLDSEIIEEEENIYQKACLKGKIEMDQPSPISILGMCFSNDNGSSFDSPINSESLNQVKQIDFGFLSSRLNFSGEIGSTFELVFSNIFLSNFKRDLGYSFNGYLVELLEGVMDVSIGDITGEEEGYQLTNFIFDCIVQWLDLKYGFLCKSGYKNWVLFSRILSKERLVEGICEEIMGWNQMGGKSLDTLAEKDLINSNFEWSESDFKGFEIGTEIEMNLIDSIVDEFVFDLY